MRIRTIFITAAVAAVAAAGLATAAPDGTATLTAANPEFNWDGVQGQHTNIDYDIDSCSKDADTYCEQYLIEVKSGGPVTMDASLTDFSNPFADFDLRVYHSDATGVAGEQVPSNSFADDPSQPNWGGPNGFEEFFHAEGLAPGFYLVDVSHFFNPGATYKGNVKITGATPVGGEPSPSPSPTATATPPPSSGTPTPAPASGPASLPFKAPSTLGSAKKAKKRKALRFKATASESISNLKLSLLDRRKKTVGKASVASFPKGTRTIKLKVRKLRAGKYQLVAEGTVNGAKQTIVQPVRIKK